MNRKNYIKLLEEAGKSDFPRAGGKGAGLGEMIQAGLPVPGGFVLLTDAYYRFVEANGLQEEIEKSLALINAQNAEKISQNIQELFKESSLPRL